MATSKQIRFAEGIVEGLNPSEAYRAAGYAASNPSTIATEAARLMRNPHVAPIIAEGREKAMSTSIWTRTEAMRRLEKANSTFLDAIEQGSVDKAVINGFLSTASALNEISDVDYINATRRKMVDGKIRMHPFQAVDEMTWQEAAAILAEHEGWEPPGPEYYE